MSALNSISLRQNEHESIVLTDRFSPDSGIENLQNENQLRKSDADLEENSENISTETKNEVECSEQVNSKLNRSNSADKSPPRCARKKRNKRARKRKWKPYCKLTWNERKKVEERDSRRAYRIREEMTSCGQPLAPYNTTQFLMEDHNVQEPDYEQIHNELKRRDNSSSGDSSGEFYSSPEDESNYLEKEFSETYESVHDAYLNNMTKFDLVEELVNLEDKVELLEKSLHDAREQKKLADPQPNALDVEAELAKIDVFREEIKKLVNENGVLWRKNQKLRKRLSGSS